MKKNLKIVGWSLLGIIIVVYIFFLVSYNNYKPDSLDIPLRELAEMFESGSLKLLSKIETEKVVVKLKPANQP